MYSLLEVELVSRYWRFFGGRGSVQNGFSFECMNGWFDLVKANLQLLERYGELEHLRVEIVQVKEKFGLLRVYHRGGDSVVDQLFDIAELVSGCVCEICGAQGGVSDHHGRLRARCILHREADEPSSVISSISDYIENYVKCVALLLWFFKDSSVTWVNQECLGLGGRRPCELLASSEGCEQVYILIRRMESGVAI